MRKMLFLLPMGILKSGLRGKRIQYSKLFVTAARTIIFSNRSIFGEGYRFPGFKIMPSIQSPKSLIFILGAILFAAPSLFFTYYTVRLIYINLTNADVAGHRSGGMLIGAIAFPVAAIVFGLVSWFCFRKARRGFTEK